VFGARPLNTLRRWAILLAARSATGTCPSLAIRLPRWLNDTAYDIMGGLS